MRTVKPKFLKAAKTRIEGKHHTSEERQQGFTLPEVIVAAVIVFGIITAFTLFASRVQNVQVSSRLDLLATRILHNEHESLASVSWDDLMMENAAEGDTCDLGGGRVSGKLVKPGPSTVIADKSLTPTGLPGGIEVSITRKVTWATVRDTDPEDGQLVTCTNGNRDRDDLKKVTITATWITPKDLNDKTKATQDEKVSTQEIVVYRSRWSEPPQ